MKNKKIVSMIVMFSIFINIISGLHIDAQAENTENSETYLWDFSKYTDKITTTKTGFTEKYDGQKYLPSCLQIKDISFIIILSK